MSDYSVTAAQPPQEIPQITGIAIQGGARAWKEFAAGGHRAADARLQEATLSGQQEAERRILDEEAEHALFGPTAGKSADDEPKQELDGATEEDSLRKRTIVKSVWTPTTLSRQERRHEKEASLLD